MITTQLRSGFVAKKRLLQIFYAEKRVFLWRLLYGVNGVYRDYGRRFRNKNNRYPRENFYFF